MIVESEVRFGKFLLQSDCQSIVSTLEYQTYKSVTLKPKYQEILKLLSLLPPSTTVVWVSREENGLADSLASSARLACVSQHRSQLCLNNFWWLVYQKSTTSNETSFDLSKGPRGSIEFIEAEELLEPLKNPSKDLKKICFSNRSFGIGAVRAAEPILALVKQQLEEVDLSDCCFGRPELEVLYVMSTFSRALQGSVLKILNLSNNALGEKGIIALSSLLKSQCALEELSLVNAGISKNAAVALCELIGSTEKLKILRCQKNLVGDEGSIAISNLVKRSPLLEVLDLAEICITSVSVPTLAASIASKENLVELNLAENELKDEGIIQISNAIEDMNNLRKLDVSTTGMEKRAARILAEVVVRKPDFEFLNVSGNFISEDGINDIKYVFKNSPEKIGY